MYGEGADNVMSPSSLYDALIVVQQINLLTKCSALADDLLEWLMPQKMYFWGRWGHHSILRGLGRRFSQRRGREVARRNKLTVRILYNTVFYSLDLSLHWRNLSGNRLWWRKCNLVVPPLLHTVNIFFSSEALCQSCLETQFCVTQTICTGAKWSMKCTPALQVCQLSAQTGFFLCWDFSNLNTSFDLCFLRLHFLAIYKVN